MNIKTIEDQFEIKFLILSIVGSKMWCLDNDESDTDYAGIYILKNPEDYCSLDNIKKTVSIQHEEYDFVGYELKHFCNLLIKCTSTVHDILFSSNKIIKNDYLLKDLLKIQKTITVNSSDKHYVSMLKNSIIRAEKELTLKRVINILKELYLHVKIKKNKSLYVKRNIQDLLEFYSDDDPLINSLILLKTQKYNDSSLGSETLDIIKQLVKKYIIEIYNEPPEQLFNNIKKMKEYSLESQKNELKQLIYNTRK